MSHKKNKKQNKPNSPFDLYGVSWTVWEDDEFGYPKQDGYTLYVSEDGRDNAVGNGVSGGKFTISKNKALYRRVRDNGGSLYTEEEIW